MSGGETRNRSRSPRDGPPNRCSSVSVAHCCCWSRPPQRRWASPPNRASCRSGHASWPPTVGRFAIISGVAVGCITESRHLRLMAVAPVSGRVRTNTTIGRSPSRHRNAGRDLRNVFHPQDLRWEAGSPAAGLDQEDAPLTHLPGCHPCVIKYERSLTAIIPRIRNVASAAHPPLVRVRFWVLSFRYVSCQRFARTFSVMVGSNADYFEQHKPMVRLLASGPLIRTASTASEEGGLRKAQVGAAFAVAAHFTCRAEAALVCMPTGSGKPAVMTLVPFLLGSSRVLVVTPSRLLREQLAAEFLLLKVLRGRKVVPEEMVGPRVQVVDRRADDAAWQAMQDFDVVVGTVNVLSPAMTVSQPRLREPSISSWWTRRTTPHHPHISGCWRPSRVFQW
jgi:type III restriction/modification enzyme restriction subunit